MRQTRSLYWRKSFRRDHVEVHCLGKANAGERLDAEVDGVGTLTVTVGEAE